MPYILVTCEENNDIFLVFKYYSSHGASDACGFWDIIAQLVD